MQTSQNILVTKANGEQELFDSEKLFNSLVRSGAEKEYADEITKDIASKIIEGEATRTIYHKAFAQLKQQKDHVAARYSVKHALLELGPSGYPFEDFLKEIYTALGYEAKTRIIVQGRCVEHELDVVAQRGEERLGAEVKFHNSAGIKSDLKVALYVQARFEDIAAQSGAQSENDYTDKLLITNTKFTKQVEAYAACVGLQLISWDYPAQGNLRELIEQTGVHPVSCLTTISTVNKRRLMEQGIVLCRQVRKRMDKVSELGLSEHNIMKLTQEIDDLCK